LSRIIYTISTFLQRLIQFTELVSNYVHNANQCCRFYFIFSTSLVLRIVCQHVLQRLINFSALVSYTLHYVNRCCSGYFILQHWSLITYTMSTCAAAVTSLHSPALLLPTLYQHVQQRILHYKALVSYYLHYVNMCCSGHFIIQHWSLITYTISTCAAAVTSLYSTGLLLPTLCQHVLQRLIHFSALVSNYLHYIKICCSGFFIFQYCSHITYNILTYAAAVT
jgi:hypothetical protein